ncbi:Uu.00g139580.m01.CDS01 [Anthostomella pinea]|uniref:Uu.00g139580.m01.CDS01 n=1 Tax=Anthostomella pinea TaxID=933095 RepID=A0AAI8VPY9_9PEZI|nr:Uu.00g139580.m01.CDS01 [Anthostomella pinea]
MGEDRPKHQPIHEAVRPLLDPEYVAFHDKYLQYVVPDDKKIWDGSARTTAASWAPTESTPVQVGAVRDIKPGPGRHFDLRVWTPEVDSSPASGYPVFLWFHGGGWAVGSVAAGNDICALICQRAACVVVSVGYRLAPEHPFPAAFDDAVGALRWVRSTEGAQELGNIDNARIAVGGTSAGAQLAASLSLQAALLQPPVEIAFQMLVLPVIDNTATTSTTWASRANAPWLTPARMLWYRKMYLREESDALRWEASPNLAPRDLLAKSPRTWIAVAEQDLLVPEAEAYAVQLREAWELSSVERADGEVVVSRYEGSTHCTLAFSGILTKGQQLLQDAANQAAAWFQR